MNNHAKQLKAAKQAGFNEGFWCGRTIMADIISIALYNCFGFGTTNPLKWDKLGAEIQRIDEELMSQGDRDEITLGFEKMTRALIKIFGEEQKANIESKYRNLLFKIGK